MNVTDQQFDGPSRPRRVVLALSGGGLFGAYQAGVWHELQRVLQPNAVLGVSVGSLNGWAIAGGASGDELRDMWRRVGSAQQLRFRFPRHALDGFIHSDQLTGEIQSLHANFQPRCDYGLVVTRFPSLRPELFVNQDVTWQHLAASCALIGLLEMRRLGKHIYADGGIVDPLPSVGLHHFQPDLIVSVNLFPSTQNRALRLWQQSLQRLTAYSPTSPAGVKVLELGPPKVLGGLVDAARFSQTNFEEWYSLGRSKVIQILPEIESFLR